MLLTKEYFESHGYTVEPFELEGQMYWKAVLRKSFESGDHVFAEAEVTNLMYDERFAFSGHIGNQCYFNTVFLYSIEDLETLYKLSHVRYDEVQNDFYPVRDFECNKDLKV